MPHDLFSQWRYSTRLLYSGCDQSVYQQDLVIHRTAGQDYEEDSGGLKIWHVYLGSLCQPDYGDLRFTDRRGRELAHYLWPGFDSSSAKVCVRLEVADADGTLVIHYGNPSATTTSDGDAVFLFFDQFDELDASKWDTTTYKGSGSISVSNGTARISTTSSSNVPAMVSADRINVSNVIIESSIKIISMERQVAGMHIRPNMGERAYSVYFLSSPTGSHEDAYLAGSSGTYVFYKDFLSWATNTWYHLKLTFGGSSIIWDRDGVSISYTTTYSRPAYLYFGAYEPFASIAAFNMEVDWVLVRTYSATPPSLLRSTRGVNPSYAGLARLTGSAAADDGVIQFTGVGSILVVGDEREAIAGAGSFAIETSVRSSIPIAGAAGLQMSLHLVPAPATPTGTGGVISEPARLHTPLGIEAGEGSAYVAPTPVQFDLTKYRFSSLTISRSAQDALWQCEGRIVGLDAPLAYKQFEVRVPDHNGVLRTLFVGFVPGRDYVRAVAADESIIQGYDAGFYLTRQYLPDGDLTYPREFGWGPARLLHYFLGEESVFQSTHP